MSSYMHVRNPAEFDKRQLIRDVIKKIAAKEDNLDNSDFVDDSIEGWYKYDVKAKRDACI